MSKKNSELKLEFIVGLFVVLMFVGLAIFTIVLSRGSVFKNSKTKIEVVMNDVMGLRKNDPVIAKGTTVGAVTEVFYNVDGVHVRAELDAPVIFYEDYKITVVATSILGGRQLVINEGTKTKTIVNDITQLVGDKPADLMNDATIAVAKLREFLETLANFESFSKDVADITKRLNNGEGTLGKLLSTDDELYRSLNSSISGIEKIITRIENGEGTIGKLLSSDDQIYENLNTAIDDLSKITSRLEQGQGTMGKLLMDNDAMYTNLMVTVENLRVVSDRLVEGEGTLGKLLSEDDELYSNVNGAVTDVREMLDDMREANTLSTFSGLLFGGF
ncbi:MAG: MCE family protein [Kiritimatiellae bacterium]|nr:MCE family protein [Kiritimatiellia bacterium]